MWSRTQGTSDRLRLRRMSRAWPGLCFFFFNDTATTEIYTLSLHDALPILHALAIADGLATGPAAWNDWKATLVADLVRDRKSTRLNSSHSQISYAVFCLKKKKEPKSDANPTSRIAAR